MEITSYYDRKECQFDIGRLSNGMIIIIIKFVTNVYTITCYKTTYVTRTRNRTFVRIWDGRLPIKTHNYFSVYVNLKNSCDFIGREPWSIRGQTRPFAASRYRSLSFPMSWNCNIFTETNTFEHAEFKSEKFPLRTPAVFSQTAILSSLISQQIFSLFNDTDRWRQTIMALKRANFY
jgi:hypothetical protein